MTERGEHGRGLTLILSLEEMQGWARDNRRRGVRTALVPTMGALHAGHASLLKQARSCGEQVVLSIFVNPLQFGPSEDLAKYPRDLDADLRLAAKTGCDVVFLPMPASMYPTGFQTDVRVREIEQGLCGAQRPGHFVGVATVVLKLLHLVLPDVALFGEKDYQQLAVIRQLVRDLSVPVEIKGCPLVRDEDGLALSSRNVYLSSAERQQAQRLSQGLFAARALYETGECGADRLLAAAQEPLLRAEGLALEYLELRDAETLRPVSGQVADPAVLLVAARVGKTRLLDNVILGRQLRVSKELRLGGDT